MNNYIEIDGLKYLTPNGNWDPGITEKPMQVRRTLLGAKDVTYGPVVSDVIEGEIEAPVTSPGTGWGNYATLEAALKTMDAVSFRDHWGTLHASAHIEGPLKKRSFGPKWDSPSNKLYITVRIHL